MSWNPVAASGYVVEIGDAPGSIKHGRFEVSATSFVIGHLAPGRVFARVIARNGNAMSAPSVEASQWYFDMKDYIEAVFMGTGPLTPTDGNHGCSATGWVRGFSRGSTVPLSVSTTVSSDKAAAIQGVANQVSQATSGAMQVAFSRTADANPLPAAGGATSTTHPSPATQGCGSNGGCTIHEFLSNAQPGKYRSSRAVQPAEQTPQAYGHDAVGHGVLGMCHVDGSRIGGAGRSLMSAGPGVYSGDIASRLTDYDLAAVQALYRAGLGAGAQRSDLLRAGLINP